MAESKPVDENYETLTQAYERIRHSHDAQALHEIARQPLPQRSDQSAFSRATALLEAVAGNLTTPVEDRIYLGQEMPFPNVLVKLSSDPDPRVREAVAANANDKNWLVGQLTKDPEQRVRTAALLNPQTSWKMRLEGAQDANTSVEALEYLAQQGLGEDAKGPTILATMVRHAVALNPTSPRELVESLKNDPEEDVRRAVKRRLEKGATEKVVTPLPVQSVPGRGPIGLRSADESA